VTQIVLGFLMVMLGLSPSVARADKPSQAEGLPRVKQVMVAPPLVPEHSQTAKGGPKIVEVRLEVQERKLVIDPQ